MIRLVLAVAAAGLILLSWQRVLAAGRGLVIRDVSAEGGAPLRFLAPDGALDIPGVVVAHGFAGSSQLMTGYAYALARAGYGVVLADFDGHGAARGVLDRQGNTLQRNLAAAYEALAAQSEIDPARIALLGHSMGSGAVMTAAIDNPDRYRATIAVSPTGAAVDEASPRNLLLMAGSLEPGFLANAQDLLAAAGGPNGDLAGGRGRALVEAPNVEHITILFSRTAQQAAIDWLNKTFALPAASVAPDRRMVWFAAHLGGWLLLLAAVAPLLPAAPPLSGLIRRAPWHWAGLILGAAATAVVLFLLGRLFDVSTLGGLLVGGALGLWFLLLGAVWLATGFRPPRPSGADVAWGVGLFLFLSLAFGVMAHRVWLPWLLIPERLALWPLLVAAMLPWALASALAQYGLRPARRLGWWAMQSVAIVGGLGLTVALSPELFFVTLLLPVFPIVLGILSIVGAVIDRPWAVAIGNALFFGWLLVAVFPLA
jgi:pimeloyl-ACP methyl ester carboxylesterase